MKKALLILFFGLFVAQQFAMGGIPIQIKKTTDDGTGVRGFTNDVSGELQYETIEITFEAELGPAEITIETPSGSVVASAYCPSTPGYVELTIPINGTYYIIITTDEGVYTGHLNIN
ncbi:MAG: hypothetical protein K6A73_04920 [Bacteroidales bacterium]|nr:hypothetical protein [Bacteroidales bacterium]